MKTILTIIAALVVAASASAALSPAQVSTIDNSISSAKLKDVSAVAKALVNKSSVEDRSATVARVVIATKSAKSSRLLAVVKEIAETNPEFAAVAAATAADLAKSQAVKIAKEAMEVAPSYANEIALKVSEVAPESAERINAAATKVTVRLGRTTDKKIAPKADPEQIKTIAEATEKVDPRRPYVQP